MLKATGALILINAPETSTNPYTPPPPLSKCSNFTFHTIETDLQQAWNIPAHSLSSMMSINEGEGVFVHGITWHSPAETPRLYYDISSSSVPSSCGKHLCVSGWKSAPAGSSSTAVDERQPLCLFVLESVLFVKAGDKSIQMSFWHHIQLSPFLGKWLI